MISPAEVGQSNNGGDLLRPPHYEGNSLRFEGINIQLDKGQWEFGDGDTKHVIDTYSIWSPSQHKEIAERLSNGEIAAAFIMGNYGVVDVRRPGVDREHDPMFEDIKKRARSENFVAFVDPDDIRPLMDIDRMPPELKHLQWAGARHDIYPGPLHAVFPLKKNAEVDPGVIRADNHSLAAFWIPGHWGYEALGNELRKKVKLGLLGGGSLNTHGEEPSYTKKELHGAFLRHPEWQGPIKMIIFDEIAEAARIGRSQTMLSFAEYPPKIVRVGSLSPAAIEMHLGMPVQFDPERMANDPKYRASSRNRYDPRTNDAVDKRVSAVMEQMSRYKDYYQGRLKGDSSVTFVPRQASHPAA